MNIAALKEAAEKATPGPWGASGLAISAFGSTNTFSGPVYGTIAITEPCMQSDEDGRIWSTRGDAEENAAFIALANPSAILSLIERCEELEGALRPFAACREHFAPEGYKLTDLVIDQSSYRDSGTTRAKLSREDFLNADAALSKADATS